MKNKIWRAFDRVLGFPERGMTLVEVLIAFTIVTLVLLGVSLALSNTAKAVFSSKQEEVASRLAQLIHAKLLQVDFDQIFSVDSNNKNPTRTPTPLYYDYETNPTQYNFWAPWSNLALTTRTLTILGQIEQEVRSAGFTRFTITVRHMRRDSSDVDNQQNVSDLTFFARYYGSNLNQVFTVTPNVNAPDDADPNIAFRDRNGDSDFWDVVGGVPETPNTDMKLLTITIYNANRVIAIKHGDLITRQQFSGRASNTTESQLKLIWKVPYQNLWSVNSTVFYQRDTLAKQNALDVPFFYQAQIDAARAPKTAGNTAT
ncbi:MAG TPA: prepilin-type N-terminal cleavage/methylation domain-containing protein, partial [Elusimicrobiota bacterium]|nr:prepilin-type N-terminal cleavage/methylation domain-containing protein [Elusimicrobiota bacterium]